MEKKQPSAPSTSNFLDQIKKGVTLHHVDKDADKDKERRDADTTTSSSTNSGGNNMMAELMNAISKQRAAVATLSDSENGSDTDSDNDFS